MGQHYCRRTDTGRPWRCWYALLVSHLRGDAAVLGREPWTPRERADRFAEFVAPLDRLLTDDSVSHEGTRYSAHEAHDIPGCVQRPQLCPAPRLPFAVAATGPRGLRPAGRHGQQGVSTGDPKQ